LYILFPILKPLINSFFLILSERISTAITNSRADKGQPCLIPDFISKYLEVCPLFMIQLSMLVYNIFTHSLNIGPKPNDDNAFSRKFQFNLSNAFSKSRNASSPEDLSFSTKSIISKILRMFKLILRPFK